MEVRGRIHVIQATEQVSATFKKRNLVLCLEGQYPQYPQFEFSQDRVTLLDGFKDGDEVEVSFDLNGREWKNPADGTVKYFTTLRGYMLKKIMVGAPPAQPRTAATAAPASPAAPGAPQVAEEDDMPF